MRQVLSTAPTSPPVSLGELREWLAFASHITEDDKALRSIMVEEYDRIERHTNRKVLTQTWLLWLDAAEAHGGTITLPFVPLVSISSIKTYDADDNETTVGTANYQVIPGENPRVVLTATGAWPSDMRTHDAMKITAVCGYESTVVPFVDFVQAGSSSDELNDLNPSGTFTGTVKTQLEVELQTEATPDTFRHRKITWDDNDQKTIGAWTSNVSIDGSAQLLADGISITFEATTGHAANSKWRLELYERLPATIRKLLKGLVIDAYSSKGRGVTETASGQIIGLPRQLEHILQSLRVHAL